MKKIIFTGGGTGGHIMPNIAIMDELKNKYKIDYIGSRNGMEKELISKNYPFFEITTCKLKRSFSLSNLLIPIKFLKGYFEAKKILKKTKPNLIFSKGGYVSVPVIFAAHKLKIPVVSHESDFTIGLANKLTEKYSKAICTSFEETSKKIKNGVYTGSPIRKKIYFGNKKNILNKYFLDSKLATILIIGGSLGSETINQIIQKNAEKLAKNFNLLHITGKNSKIESKIKNYHTISFAENIEDFYDASEIVITRGGSNVIFELLALKKPMLIIPLEKGSRGDQVLNAKEFTQKGFASTVFEDELETKNDILFNTLLELQKNKTKIQNNMEKQNIDENKNIITQIEKYIN